MVELKIRLRKDLVAELDKMINGVEVRDRSHAAEILLSRMLHIKKVDKVVVLAGGKGTRMRPFTYEMPKPMIPVQGKPLLQHIVELLRKYDVRDIIFSIGYMGDKIREYFGNGSRFGVNISYVEEKEEMGTAGALSLMEKKLNGTFLMFNGDILANIDLHDFIMFHRQNKALATIALTPVKDPSRFGVAHLKGNKIIEFIEKPKGSLKSRLINAGVYVLEGDVLDYIPKRKAMMETDVFPKLAEEGKLFGYPFDGQWFDTGTHEAYERAIKEWKGIK